MEAFGHEDVDQVLGEVVFDAQDHIDVVWRNLPLRTHAQKKTKLHFVKTTNPKKPRREHGYMTSA